MQKQNVTDRQIDGRTDGQGAFQYLPSWAFGVAGDTKYRDLRGQNVWDFEVKIIWGFGI